MTLEGKHGVNEKLKATILVLQEVRDAVIAIGVLHGLVVLVKPRGCLRLAVTEEEGVNGILCYSALCG